jgi:hypothetical protein
MRTTSPPRMATWLLTRLAADERRDSLIGDLMEQYTNGHSAWWYWRQTLFAIVLRAGRDICVHKRQAIHAVLIGFACMWIFGALARVGLQILWLFATGGVYLSGHWMRLDYGWIRHPLYLHFLLLSLGSAASGWTVGRLHRDIRAPMVLAYLISVVLTEAVQLELQVRLIGWTIRPLVPYPLMVLPFFFTVPISILLGGLWGRRPSVQSPSHPSNQALVD